jgi:hypothetical protein
MKSLNQRELSRQQFLTKADSECASTGIRRKRHPGTNFSFARFTGLVMIFMLIIAVAKPLSRGQDSSSLTAAEVRKIIADGNRQWGKARVEYDKKTFEKMLAADFYVQLPGRRLTRQEFIEGISIQRQGFELTRFDATVLTVQPSADGWVAVIHEKLEIDSPKGKIYSLWITRDGWKKLDNHWVITFSEAIGSEQWSRGEKPPFPDW